MMQHSQQTTSYTIVVGLNPALQRRFVLSPKTPLLTPGNVHRASEIQEGIGGKGQDVYVALHCLSTFRTTAASAGSTSTGTVAAVSDTPYRGFNNNGNNSINKNNNSTTRHSNSKVTNVILAQFLGKGIEGDTVLSYFLDRYERDMDLSLTIRSEEKLRICTTIVDSEQIDHSATAAAVATSSSSSTELIEPSGTIQQHEVEELRQSLKGMTTGDLLTERPVMRGICIMGSMPPGCPNSLYADLYRNIMSQSIDSASGGGIGLGTNAGSVAEKNTAKEHVPLCLVDSVVGLDHLFHEMNVHRNRATSTKTNMLKINLSELCNITGTSPCTSKSKSKSTTSMVYDVSNAEVEVVQRAILALYTKFPESREALDYVAVTNGIFPAYMVHVNTHSYNSYNDTIYRFNVPRLSQLRISAGLADDSNNVIMGGGTPVLMSTRLYTIGAGDAVAASTLAAWEYLNNRKEDQRLDESIRASLLKRVVFGEDIANTAFSFGLACGTASCVERENSVFDVSKAMQLFEQMERPHKVKLAL